MIARPIVIGLVALSLLTEVASASDARTLSSVAAADGYTFAWLPTEGGVVLTRPGLRIVLRAGRLFYEVNNATPIADRAPEFDGEDLLISPALAERLRQIALQAPAAAGSLSETRPAAAPAPQPGAARRLTVDVKPVHGRVALALSGTGTPNAEITLTLTGEMSSDLPAVTLRRTTITIGSDGAYAIVVGYGLDAHKGTRITTAAAYTAGSGSATAHIVVNGEPFGVDATTLDEFPKN